MLANLRPRVVPYVLLLVLGSHACRRSDTSTSSAPASRPLTDAALAAPRLRLLETAFRAASALPANPHTKTRSRLQEQVANTCLQLGAPAKAARCFEQIDDWRRGLGYAVLAGRLAQDGDAVHSTYYLNLARQIADSQPLTSDQEWRRDRIRAHMARAHLLLGQDAAADQLATGLVESEVGTLAVARAERQGVADFAAQLAAVDGALKQGSLDAVQGALDVCLKLYEGYLADPARRTELEARVLAERKVPAALAIERIVQLADLAIRHGQQDQARGLLREAGQRIEHLTWLPEDHIPLLARLAAAQARGGDRPAAATTITTAHHLFDQGRERIADIYRSRCLRALAEAQVTVGDVATAQTTYQHAVAESLVNPNSRPRAEDLVAICCSLALQSITPDAALLTRIDAAVAALGAPW